MCKRIFSVILSLSLVMVQSMNVNAAGNEGLSAEQLNALLEGMDSIVLQLEELGLSDSEINGLFQFTPREDNFYKVTQVMWHLLLILLAVCWGQGSLQPKPL